MPLVVTEAGPVRHHHLAVVGGDSLSDFRIDTVGGNADITVCFCAGGRIRTPRGEIEVEKLAVGDTVTTWRRQIRPAVWVDTGKVPAARNRGRPVIVGKGALRDNMPHSDLLVDPCNSPRRGVYVSMHR
ncbi:Hint domain-containing protein [Acidisphaera sp. S103]|uniref:Hint domain-containing protein n=1 Tax=Acidisphaera sp. S103 TaxID=1747223 RepID=UPI00131EAC2B